MLSTLENLIKLARERRSEPVEGSYTNKLLTDKALSKAKVLEEVDELIEAIEKDTNKILTDILKENPNSLNKDVLTNTLSYPLKEAREVFETNYLINQLKKNNGNISKTADFIGMERSALHRKLKILGVKGLN